MEGSRCQELTQIVYEVLRKWNNSYAAHAKRHGLTYSQLLILGIIYRDHGECLQKNICEETLLPKQTVNQVVNSFVQQGILRLAASSSDRRSKYILVTEKGQQYMDSILPAVHASELRAMEELDAEPREIMCKELDHYVSLCKKYLDDCQ